MHEFMSVLLVRVPKCAPDWNMNDLIFIIESFACLILFYGKKRTILIFLTKEGIFWFSFRKGTKKIKNKKYLSLTGDRL